MGSAELFKLAENQENQIFVKLGEGGMGSCLRSMDVEGAGHKEGKGTR